MVSEESGCDYKGQKKRRVSEVRLGRRREKLGWLKRKRTRKIVASFQTQDFALGLHLKIQIRIYLEVLELGPKYFSS